MPDANVVNKDFLKDVLSGKKQLMKKTDVHKIAVPHYDELSVKALWPDVSKDPEFTCYFPDKYPAGRGPPRQYFFDILNTLQPQYLKRVLAHASEQRMAADGADQTGGTIAISKFWEEELKAMPYLSQKSGKTLHLLKQSSNKISTGKKRKKHSILGSLSEWNQEQQNSQNSQQLGSQPLVPNM